MVEKDSPLEDLFKGLAAVLYLMFFVGLLIAPIVIFATWKALL